MFIVQTIHQHKSWLYVRPPSLGVAAAVDRQKQQAATFGVVCSILFFSAGLQQAAAAAVLQLNTPRTGPSSSRSCSSSRMRRYIIPWSIAIPCRRVGIRFLAPTRSTTAELRIDASIHRAVQKTPRPCDDMATVGMFRSPAEKMRQSIDEAAEILAQRVDPHVAAHDIAIPSWVFAKARGLVFMWEYKVRILHWVHDLPRTQPLLQSMGS